MTRSRRNLLVWGICAVVFTGAAVLAAALLTGSVDDLVDRIVGCVVFGALFVTGMACAAQLVRTYVSNLLNALNLRIDRRITPLLIAADENRQILSIIDREICDLKDAVTIVRKQSRAVKEDLHRIYPVVHDTHRVLTRASEQIEAVGSSIGSVPAQEPKSTQTAKDLVSHIEELQLNQRRMHNFLRREGSVQVVLDRLRAAEARLVSSYESGALTAVEEMSDLLESRLNDLNNGLNLLHAAIEHAESAISCNGAFGPGRSDPDHRNF